MDPVTWEAIDAWARRSGESPEAWEINVIERLDDEFLSPPEKQKSEDKAAEDAKQRIRGVALDRRVVKRRSKTKI